MIKIHVHFINKILCQIFFSKSYLESMGYEKKNIYIYMRIKDAMLKEHEPKK
jgi:hypothetical protein